MRREPRLLVFPLVVALLTVVLAVFFLSPVALLAFPPQSLGSTGRAIQEGLRSLLVIQATGHGGQSQFHLTWLTIAFWGTIYLLSMFLATFCNVAFFHEILAALNGESVSLARGFRAAFQRLRPILLWSLVAGVVGIIIRAVEARLNWVGRFIAGGIGLSWSVASLFVIPMLVRNPASENPFKLLSQSAAALKRTWGEALTGFIGLESLNLIVMGLSLLYWILVALVVNALGRLILLLPAGAFWLLALFVATYFTSVASKVYLGALYIYAVEGVVPEEFDDEMMDAAWKIRPQ